MANLVCDARGIDVEKCTHVFGVDGGRGRLTVTLTLNGPIDNSDTKYKDNGSRRAIIVGCVNTVPENYNNMNIIYEKIVTFLTLKSLLTSK